MGVEVYLHSFLTPALDGSGQYHAPAVLSSGKSRKLTLYETVPFV